MEGLTAFRACRWSTTSLSREQLAKVRTDAATHPGEHAVLETCQRVEVYSFGECGCEPGRSLTGFAAVAALSEVAAGLDAVVLGEDQVFGQVRQMLLKAPLSLRQPGILALAAARELRREFSRNATSGQLLDAALTAAKIPAAGRIAVLGTGHMARLVTMRARESGFDEIVVAGRTAPAGEWLSKTAATFVPLISLNGQAPFNVAVGCLAGTAPLVDAASRLPKVHLLIDLGTPRTFSEPAPARLIDMAELEGCETPESLARREHLRGRLRTLLKHRIAMSGETGASPVGELRMSVEKIRQRELRRMERLHPQIPTQTLDVFTRALVNQIFHAPSVRLRELNDPRLTEQFVRLFRDPQAGLQMSEEQL